MKHLLPAMVICFMVVSCGHNNSKEGILSRQAAIKKEIKAVDDSLMAIRPGDTISVDPQQRPAAAWAEEEKRKPLVQKKEVLQKELDSLGRELKKQ